MKILASWVLAALLAGCGAQSTSLAPQGTTPARGARLEAVVPHTLVLKDFRLKSGVVMPQVTVAYETHGTLAPDGRNAILVSHGNTSTFHAAGHYAPGQAPPHVPQGSAGWWDAIIGPGKAFDTNRYLVVSSNMLGGAYGTTGPRSVNPATGKAYGPDFPEITLEDMVAVQHALLEALGVKHLVAAAGPSYGGFLTFQWGISYPDMVDGLVVVVSSPDGGGHSEAIQRIEAQLARDPHWNGGRYYENGGILGSMTDLRVNTLVSYGLDDELAAQYPDKAARAAEIRRRAEPWARDFDGNSLIVQRRAMEFRKHSRDFGRIHAKVLYILSTTDKLFPTTLAPKVMGELKAAGVDATYFELVSDKGHSGGTADAAKFAPALGEFLARLSDASQKSLERR
jgi:homoserine O-acetyltransferase/O-succinyltransferase